MKKQRTLLLFIALTLTTSPLVNGSEKSEEINEKILEKILNCRTLSNG